MATAGPLAISNHTQLAVSIQAHKTSATINNPVSREQSQIDTIRECYPYANRIRLKEQEFKVVLPPDSNH